MPINRKGLSNNISIPSNLQSGDLAAVLGNLESKIKVGRVKDIILNTNYPEIEKYGGESAIGTIFFESQNKLSSKSLPARPFYPQNSSFPLVNELVLLFQLPNAKIGKNRSEKSYYYINMISLWNHPHHNAYPNPASLNALLPTTNETYDNIEKGMVRNSQGEISTLNLNSPNNSSQATFIERSNIHPLLPFAGDIIHQGRWGNTIRLGSTSRNPVGQNLNPWSSKPSNGDPITLIKNGQPLNSSNQGWTHIVEDINNDLSSLYLTSTQLIPLSLSSENYRSFSSPPQLARSYSNPQIILNSDRVIINAKTDSILLSAQKSVSLSTNESVNINTKTLSIDAGKINLGSKDAPESVVRGDTLYFQLNSICDALTSMLEILSTSKTYINGVPANDIKSNQVYSSVKTQIEQIQEYLPEMLSKNVKTI
jgi:hypothetical protein